MKIYIAASAPNVEKAREVASLLRSWGYEPTSTWHDAGDVGYEQHGAKEHEIEIPESMADKALLDEEHVRAADVLVIITGDTLTRGGRHAECGMAIALGKRVYLLGPREQVFHWHTLVLPCDSTDALRTGLDMAPPF